MKSPWQILPLAEAFVVALCPPCFPIQRCEVPDSRSIVDDEEPCDLLVAAVRRLDCCFENEVDVGERYRVRPKPADRTLREDRLAKRHRQTGVVHGQALLEHRSASSLPRVSDTARH